MGEERPIRNTDKIIRKEESQVPPERTPSIPAVTPKIIIPDPKQPDIKSQPPPDRTPPTPPAKKK